MNGALRSKVSSLLSCHYAEGGLLPAPISLLCVVLDGRGGFGGGGALKVAACGPSSLIGQTQGRILSPCRNFFELPSNDPGAAQILGHNLLFVRLVKLSKASLSTARPIRGQQPHLPPPRCL